MFIDFQDKNVIKINNFNSLDP